MSDCRASRRSWLCCASWRLTPHRGVPYRSRLPPSSSAGLEILRIRPNFYMIAGAGGNIAVQVGADGVVLVDTGSRANVEDVMTAVRKIASTPIRFIVNTSADADHVGGNERLLQDGQASFDTIANLFPRNYFLSGAVAILASEAVLRRMTAPTGHCHRFRFPPGPPRRSRPAAATCISMTRASRSSINLRPTRTAMPRCSSVAPM